MKRIALILISLMVAIPVFASRDGLTRKQRQKIARFKKEAIATINSRYMLPKDSAAFEIICSDDGEGDDVRSDAEGFVVNLSPSAPKSFTLPTALLSNLKDHDGFCMFGPVNVEVRKQEALRSVDQDVEFIQRMFRAVNEKENNETLHGHIDHPKAK